MNESFNDIKKITKDLDGWLSDSEGNLLFDLAYRCLGKGVIVEIGSWKGKSTIWLAKGSGQGRHIPVYAIDPHVGSPEHKAMFDKVNTLAEFKANIKNAQVDDIVHPLVMSSQEAAQTFDKPVEFIFIDGAHEYEFVALDFQLWFPKVIPGGIMAFHDTIGFKGPREFVNKFVFGSRHFRNIRQIDDITVVEKVENNSWPERAYNHYALIIKKCSELAVDMRLPRSFRNAGKRRIQHLQRK